MTKLNLDYWNIMNQRLLIHLYTIFLISGFLLMTSCNQKEVQSKSRNFNGEYFGEYLNGIAFPVGGIGAGMICVEGTGAVSHVSVRNHPDISNEPYMYAALCIKGREGNTAKILEGQVRGWKRFLREPGGGLGESRSTYGLPRFESNTFIARFPFAKINLEDDSIPFNVVVTAWSPFIPGDADNSSLPVGAMEYHFVNSSDETHEAVFSFTSENFMHLVKTYPFNNQYQKGESIKEFPNGFLLWQEGAKENPQKEGGFAFFVDDENVKVNHCLFRGVQDDTKTIAWKNVKDGNLVEKPAIDKSPGATLSVPFVLKPGEEKTICLKFCWFVPNTSLRTGGPIINFVNSAGNDTQTYKPWYSGRFHTINELAEYWKHNYNELHKKSELFTDAFYSSTLPGEVIEAVSANLSILKSPTVLRQTDGRIWGWEGCGEKTGECPGSCTHVWNYAQSIPHLFPELERSLRETEFNESQTEEGFQRFRAFLPIRESGPGSRAAADGQLGGIMKVYREWRISGNTFWLKELWPEIKQSMAYCIKKWDPLHKGIMDEPAHNTYDIEFWGPEPMATNFYLGALTAMVKMGKELNDDVMLYNGLLKKGKNRLETELFNGEYFVQKVQWEGLQCGNPFELAEGSWSVDYDYPESIELFEKEGPKYQYGNGCLSQGVFGLGLAKICGIDEPIVAPEKVKSHLRSVYKYNFRKNLINHENPERPGYAMGNEGGLLICTWPKGNKPTLPMVYCEEVWTGIEYQVASHLISEGMVEEGLEIVRTCRKRYDGRDRNPFDEYELGHWYARAMSSYGLLQALTGLRYDAVDKILHIDSKLGDDFQCFISTETGFGVAGLKKGRPFINIKLGEINVKNCFVANNKMDIDIVK